MKSKEFLTTTPQKDGTYKETVHEFTGGSDRECKQAAVNSAAEFAKCDKELVKVVKLT